MKWKFGSSPSLTPSSMHTQNRTKTTNTFIIASLNHIRIYLPHFPIPSWEKPQCEIHYYVGTRIYIGRPPSWLLAWVLYCFSSEALITFGCNLLYLTGVTKSILSLVKQEMKQQNKWIKHQNKMKQEATPKYWFFAVFFAPLCVNCHENTRRWTVGCYNGI